jgi:hypothetical protein
VLGYKLGAAEERCARTNYGIFQAMYRASAWAIAPGPSGAHLAIAQPCRTIPEDEGLI